VEEKSPRKTLLSEEYLLIFI